MSGNPDAGGDVGGADGLAPAAGCGDGILGEWEECDPGLVGQRECATACGTDGTRRCTGECVWGACEAQEICGNDVDEDCDGRIAGFEVVGEVETSAPWASDVMQGGEAFVVSGDGVWESDYGPVRAVFLGVLEPSGEWRGDPTRLTDSGAYESADPSVAFSGSEYGVAWIDSEHHRVLATRSGIFFTRVSSSGEKIGSDVPIVRDPLLEPIFRTPPEVVWTGSEYGVLWSEGGFVRLARVSPGGALVDEPGYIWMDEEIREAFWTGTGYHLFLEGAGTRVMARISGEGGLLGTVELPEGESFDVAFSGSGFGLAWAAEGERRYPTQIVFAELGMDGSMVGEPRVIQDGVHEARVEDVESWGTGYVVVGTTSDTYVVGPEGSEDMSSILYERDHVTTLTFVPDATHEAGPPSVVLHGQSRYAFVDGVCVAWFESIVVFRVLSLISTGPELALFYEHGDVDCPSLYMLRIGCPE